MRALCVAENLRDLFLLDPDVVFLNHGSFGACPRAVFDEYQRLQLELEREPVDFLDRHRRFPTLIETARERIAAYVGARASDLARSEEHTSELQSRENL